MTPVVKRSALKMWLMAMGGIPLLVISLDVLTNRRITNWLRELIFRPEDTQIFEPRDVIWAWVMALFAVFFVAWGLKELFVPTKVVECRDTGLALRLGGPLSRPSVIPWDWIVDIDGASIEDDGQRVPVLRVEVLSREGLPDDPWGARWLGERRLGLLAQDWSAPPGQVAEQIADFAVESARRRSRTAVAKLWEDES